MQLKKFISRLVLFTVIGLCLFFLSILVIYKVQNRYSYHNWNTDSDVMIIPKNKNFDLLFLGSSHARIFTRDYNHQRVEGILHKSLIDLGKGGGEGGIVTNLIMTKYFYEQGNKAKHIVYFIDAWPFFSAKWNEQSYFLTNEPISWKLFVLALKYHVSRDVLLNYFKSKYDLAWWQKHPQNRIINNDMLGYESPEAIKKRIASLYIEPYDEKVFNHYAERLEELVKTAKAHGTIVTFAFPATLLDDNRGKDKVIALLQRFKTEYGTAFYDESNAVPDYHFYYDHDHLNSFGIIYFTEHFLGKIINDQ